jgi:hypothetical protein
MDIKKSDKLSAISGQQKKFPGKTGMAVVNGLLSLAKADC